jgi:hypothetical protein
MSKIKNAFLALLAIVSLTACGGGIDLGEFPKLSSITVGGTAVSTTSPINIKMGQALMVTTSAGRVFKDSVFKVNSTLNGASTPTVLADLTVTDTSWRALINAAVGSVMTITVLENSTRTPIATLIFNVQAP